MKKFRFNLEAVERHRKLQEQEKQVWLAKCVEQMRGTERRLTELDQREVDARRQFSALGQPNQRETITSAKFWLIDQFIRGQKVRRLDLKQKLQIEENEVGMAYQEFLRARQQKKIMEKLHEKRLAQYKDKAKKEENRDQDEQYILRDRLRPVDGTFRPEGDENDEE